MGLTISRPLTDGVRIHLLNQTRLIEDLQVYLNKVSKLLADSEATHKGVRRAVESFFPADAPSHEAVIKLMQCMKAFEQARGDLQPLLDEAKKTFQTLLEKAHRLERLMKQRDKLLKKVGAYEKKLEKIRGKYTANPTPALTKRIFKMETAYSAVKTKFKTKDAETQVETSNAMDGRYAEATTLVAKTALIIIQYVLILTPEMQRGHNLLALLEQSVRFSQSTTRPFTPASSALKIYTPQQADIQLSEGDPLGEPLRSLQQPIQQPSVDYNFPEKTGGDGHTGDRDSFKNEFQQPQPVPPSTMPSPDMSPHQRAMADKEEEKSVARTAESSGQVGANSSLPRNPFENDL